MKVVCGRLVYAAFTP
ncbi:hypothetical protein QO226_22485 [Vibrio vulnificus]|nr:hypothetical protein [Vibrio vulnificus]MCU8120511.1 hypothetical protein [Vibrio vulnificus]MCU8124825.1 hypothetical protein [Vibrio vulnificus]MCU8133311.1 hypothetical protein [Vibrio vulnificus]MCU8133494.1 hypothetical protein [Vibrio vulnificus]MCU8238656.1 hypothetical protein [Vibrio vulnificus]